jgi:ferredoxin
MPYRVTVDRVACIACGVAPATCSKVFELRQDNGKNSIKQEYELEHSEERSVGVIPDDLYECVKLAVDSCPVQAIKMERT